MSEAKSRGVVGSATGGFPGLKMGYVDGAKAERSWVMKMFVLEIAVWTLIALLVGIEELYLQAS